MWKKIKTQIKQVLYSLLIFSVSSHASNEMFSCKLEKSYDIHMIFSNKTNVAELIFDSSHINGTMNYDDHHYFFKFPKTIKRHEIHATINRYSGKLIWEIGSSPFGESSSKNIHSSGACKKSKVKRVL